MGIIRATDLSFGSSFFAKSRPVLIERMFACKFDGYFTAKTDGGQPREWISSTCGEREQRDISISLTEVKKKPRHKERGRHLELPQRPDYSTEMSLNTKSTMSHSMNSVDTSPLFPSAFMLASFADAHAQCNSNPYFSFLKFWIFSSVNLVNPFIVVLSFCKFNFPKPGLIANISRKKHDRSTFLVSILQFIRLRWLYKLLSLFNSIDLVRQ